MVCNFVMPISSLSTGRKALLGTTPYHMHLSKMVSTERMNRPIISKACCMLSNSGLSRKFWAEVAFIACYLINSLHPLLSVRKLQSRCGLVRLIIIRN
jgi:hypothetical protein